MYTGGWGGGGGVEVDTSPDNLRPAPVRLTSSTSDGTVCSGFGRGRSTSADKRLNKVKYIVLCVCVCVIGISTESVRPGGSGGGFTRGVGGVFGALSVGASAS